MANIKQKKVLALTHILQATDKVEHSILDQIVKPVINQDTYTVVDYWAQERFRDLEGADQYLVVVKRTGAKLMQSYQYHKNYIIVENKITEDLERKIAKSKIHIDQRWFRLELTCEIDAFLSKWKSTLDSLVKTLIPIFGIRTLTFERDNQYHFKFIKELKNSSPNDIKKKTDKLCKFVIKNSEMLHRIIKLRDDVIHYDKELLTPFHYRLDEHKLYRPNLSWEDRDYDPKEFMLSATEFLRDFIKDFILLSLNSLVSKMELHIFDSNFEWRLEDKKINGIAIFKKEE